MSALDRLHPDLVPFAETMGTEPMSDERVAMVRSVELPSTPSPLVDQEDVALPGDPELVVRVYRPKEGTGPRPCLYWIHGGGFVLGSPAMDDERLNRLCAQLGIVGVSVDYRLAPETPYPGPLEDCARGLDWVFAHADDLGIDATRVGIGGVSAGGGLAAALALLVRDRGEPRLRFQLLDSPMLDDRQQTWSIRQDGLPVWSRESNTYGWRSYLGDRYGRDDVPPTAAPARATDLSGLPPAYVSVGTVDGFLDEDVDYAMRLNRAGVPTELHVYPGACHGYHLVTTCEVTQQSQRDEAAWLARQIRA